MFSLRCDWGRIVMLRLIEVVNGIEKFVEKVCSYFSTKGNSPDQRMRPGPEER